MQLYEEVFRNESNLDRWLRRLVNKWRAVKELDENGRKYYTKTELGELLKRILKYHSDVCYPLKDILVGFEPRFSPPEEPDQSLGGSS
jgi:DNA-binding PadR family transcriptional regulator